MRDQLFGSVMALAIATGGVVWLPSTLCAQASKSSPVSAVPAPMEGPGVIISVGVTATISTKGMSPGGEIWAEWYSLPPKQAVVEVPGAAKWAYVAVALDGAAVITGNSTPLCSYFSAGGRQADGSERITDAGDFEICNYGSLTGSRTENQGSQPYVFAALSVGGPWKEGTEDTADLYLKVNGLAKTTRIDSSQFGAVEKEILKASAMRVSIRNITLLPGSRIEARDHHPTLRMVENGQLTLSSALESSNAVAPKILATYDMMEWSPENAERHIVLSNNTDQPVRFVEWSVAPVQRAIP